MVVEKMKKLFREWGIPFLIVFTILTPIRSVLADYNYIPSGSMKPTLMVGDNIFVNKLAYSLRVPFTSYSLIDWADPQPGQVVVFYQPDEKMMMVKRVVGIPGDVVEMRNNRLFINNKPFEYKEEKAESDLSETERKLCVFGSEKIGECWHSYMEMPFSPSIQNFGPIKIPEGKYFMMGDNRDNSKDSRFWGLIERRNIVGRAELVLWSKKAWELTPPLWQRVFKPIV